MKSRRLSRIGLCAIALALPALSLIGCVHLKKVPSSVRGTQEERDEVKTMGVAEDYVHYSKSIIENLESFYRQLERTDGQLKLLQQELQQEIEDRYK